MGGRSRQREKLIHNMVPVGALPDTTLQGVLELHWPFTVEPRGEVGVGALDPSISQSVGYRLHLVRRLNLEQAVPCGRGQFSAVDKVVSS